jgi:hypothetical protein
VRQRNQDACRFVGGGRWRRMSPPS